MADIRLDLSRRRQARDRAASLAINAAGSAVIVLILLILAYLLYVTVPLTSQAEVLGSQTTALPAGVQHAVSAEDGSLWRLMPDDGTDGSGARDQGLRIATAASGTRALQFLGDRILLYDLVTEGGAAFAGSSAGVDPPPAARLRFVSSAGSMRGGSLAFDSQAESAMYAYFTEDNALQVGRITGLGIGADVREQRWRTESPALTGGTLLIDSEMRLLIVVQGGRYLRWQLPKVQQPGSLSSGTLTAVAPGDSRAAWGPDHETVLLFDASRRLHRFDPLRVDLAGLGEPRSYAIDAHWVGSEIDRRVSYLLAPDGELMVLVPSSGDLLLQTRLPALAGDGYVGVSADGRAVFRINQRELARVLLHNPYPETGWRSLWSAQWYGGYQEPGYTWHPDGAAIGVLSKLSLTPLLYGTFKAALYGMLLAIPLAMGAAIYTGYFLPPRIRNRVKPAIEMLEAFPTVVLGFIAGLWLAPLLLDYLVPILMLPLLLILLPLTFALAHLALQTLSPRFQQRPPRLLLVAVGYIVALSLLIGNSQALELWLFDGSIRDWLWSEFSINYEQRNALLVGMAMGIAITPTMFSIVEDAIFAVPRNLSDGSLALGATRWQSLSRVVLPAASPAILSALLIGLARGLGETMIVLLATGNTPLLEPGFFSGLRSLSATIAVELPEAGSSSVQFRLLFLAALVLFALTFVMNTLAELLRQRLRYNYALR